MQNSAIMKLLIVFRVKSKHTYWLTTKHLFFSNTKAHAVCPLILKTNKPMDTSTPAWQHDEAYQRLWDVKHSLSTLIVSLFH